MTENAIEARSNDARAPRQLLVIKEAEWAQLTVKGNFWVHDDETATECQNLGDENASFRE